MDDIWGGPGSDVKVKSDTRKATTQNDTRNVAELVHVKFSKFDYM